ncbi:MAG: molybdopterin-guanine dinucleotide biosynthesis protein B [Gemmatimonadales bacterium]|nr:molybdopterin-guanine dinucleotide biosynthesis protein B [Gemmatimonadales bacterium]
MRIVSIIGLKDAGKTTLLVALARELHRRGRRVATIKHATHPADLDREGTDTWRHYHEGLADGVLIASPGVRAVFERRADDTDPETLARRYFADRDIVLVEGFKSAPLPKIEIFRTAVGPSPLVAAAADKSHWVAVVSDTAVAGVTCPVLRFTDTMWLQLLAALAWDRAKVLEP